MATLLFYQKPVPLNSGVHLQARIRTLAGDFSFAANTNSVPLAAVEFFDAVKEYPVVFTGQDGAAQFPIALLGARHNENLLISEDGKWEGRYIPAFVRRYPFVLAERESAEDFNVYLDEAYPGLNTSEGERLFNDDGSQTPQLKQALEFLSTYQGEVKRTRAFVDRLQALNLLVPRVLEIARQGQSPMVLQGFNVVDEERLLALEDAQLVELARNGYLAWIHAHLMSLGNINLLAQRLDARLAKASAGASAAEGAVAADKPEAPAKPAASKKH